MLHYDTWKKELLHELGFWQHWLTTNDVTISEQRSWRLKPNKSLDGELGSVIFPDGDGLVLDVGAGPLTTIGNIWQGRKITLIPIDPLANEYNEILKKVDLKPAIKTVAGQGERLVEQFGQNTIDAIYCANSLDHCYDPLFVILQMVSVLKPSGIIKIVSFVNEGEKEKYAGLHQWNLCPSEEDIILWNNSITISLSQELSKIANLKAIRVLNNITTFLLSKK